MDWYLNVLKNYFGFGGRARRKEYWMFVLVNIIFTFVLGILDRMLGWERAGGVRHINDDLRGSGLYPVVGGTVSAFT